MRRVSRSVRIALVVASLIAVAVPAAVSARTTILHVSVTDLGPNYGYLEEVQLNSVEFIESDAFPPADAYIEITTTLICPAGSTTYVAWVAHQKKTGLESAAGTSEHPACGDPVTMIIQVVDEPRDTFLERGWILVDLEAIACEPNGGPCDFVVTHFDVNAR